MMDEDSVCFSATDNWLSSEDGLDNRDLQYREMRRFGFTFKGIYGGGKLAPGRIYGSKPSSRALATARRRFPHSSFW